MNILEAFCDVILLVHSLDATSTDCTTKIYLSSNGFSCYPCPPGFRVLEECKRNATINTCSPCAEGYYQPNCTQATSCAMCGSCPQRMEITRNCTRIQETTCACLEKYSLVEKEHSCISSCPPSKKIIEGDEGKGLLCVPCEADTFSNETNSRKCEQCLRCSDYKATCTNTSDAVCNQPTTKTVATETVTSNTVITDRLTNRTTSTCEECNHGALIAVSLTFALTICITSLIFIVSIKRKWLFISKELRCCVKKQTNNADTAKDKIEDKKQELNKSDKKEPESGNEMKPLVGQNKGDLSSLFKGKGVQDTHNFQPTAKQSSSKTEVEPSSSTKPELRHDQTINLFEKRLQKFESGIAQKGWQVRGHTPLDGNCFFWAVKDQIHKNGMGRIPHTELRQKVVQYMQNLTKECKAEVEKFLTCSFNEYIDNMSRDETYVDHVTMQNACNALCCNISVVHADKNDILLRTEAGNKPTLVLGYIHDKEHYVSLEPIHGIKPDISNGGDHIFKPRHRKMEETAV